MVEAHEELRIELLEALVGQPVRNEDEVHAVHLAPVLVERPELADVAIERGAGERRELGDVDVVQRQ